MMSLGSSSKGRSLPPGEEERKNILRQMKVRTTLKGDKSWINKQEETESRTMELPSNGRHSSSSSPPVTPRSNNRGMFTQSEATSSNTQSAPDSDCSKRPPNAKAPTGYIIRGVFTKTIDNTTQPQQYLPNANGVQKRAAVQAKVASLPRQSNSGYKMTTEDYKKLAPYNVRRSSVDTDEEESPFSSEEQKRRSEAASSVVRKAATRERSYVLSAAKKSTGSPTQDVPPPFIAKRVEIVEEEGPSERSQSSPASARPSSGLTRVHGARNQTGSTSETETTSKSPVPTSRGLDRREEVENRTPEPQPRTESNPRAIPTPEKREEAVRKAPEPQPRTETKPSAPQTAEKSEKEEEAELISWSDVIVPRVNPSPSTSSVGRIDKSPEPQLRNEEKPKASSPDGSEKREETPIPARRTTPPDQKVEIPRIVISPEISQQRSNSQTQESTEITRENQDEVSRPKEEAGFAPKRPAQGSEENTVPRTRDSRGEMPSEVDSKEAYPDVDRSSTWSTDSNHGSTGSQNEDPEDAESNPQRRSIPNYNEKNVTSNREITRNRETGSESSRIMEDELHGTRSGSHYRESCVTETRREHSAVGEHREPYWNLANRVNSEESCITSPDDQYGRPFNMDFCKPSPNIPSTSNATVTTTETRYGGPPNGDDSNSDPTREPESGDLRTGSQHGGVDYSLQRTRASYEDKSITVTTRETRLDTPAGNRPDPNTSDQHFRDCSVTTTELTRGGSPQLDNLDPSSRSKEILFVKKYTNTSELSRGKSSSSPYGSTSSLDDWSDIERSTSSASSYQYSNPPQRVSDGTCTYCSREIGDCPKITLQHLGICCHDYCFKCGICHKPMGDLLDQIFIHRDTVHCQKCYEKLF
ncbi:zinc finger protein 185 isoform X3 [Ornithorhynchus anatinus]|uniref:zinc finger protein 185 isoform X3 n=1 Tax=Ornithorhynchus anatinus TaxID=9258 RepID=UPI0019D452A9|nr:zinc finger protein 185 isoform X3 [Ornithorhynchus anatinus]